MFLWLWWVFPGQKHYCVKYNASEQWILQMDRSIACRKDKSITRISPQSDKDKDLSFPWILLSHAVNLLVGCWLVTPEWCHIWDSVLASDDVQHLNLAPAVAKSAMMNASLCCWTHTYLSSMALCPYSSWAHWTRTWRVGKRGWQQSHSAYLRVELLWIHLLISIYMEYKSLFTLLPFAEIIHILLPQMSSLTNFLLMLFTNPWPSSQATGQSPSISELLVTHKAISPSK